MSGSSAFRATIKAGFQAISQWHASGEGGGHRGPPPGAHKKTDL